MIGHTTRRPTNEEIAKFWQEISQTGPKTWLLTSVVGVLAVSLSFPADFHTFKGSNLLVALALRSIMFFYFLINVLLPYLRPNFVSLYYQTLMVLSLYVVGIPVTIMSVLGGPAAGLYFMAIIEIEFAAATFFTISKKKLITGIVVVNTFFISYHVLFEGWSFMDQFNIAISLLIFAILAIYAHHTILGFKIKNYMRRQELVSSQKEFEIILSRITDGFFALDNDWRFIYINREAVNFLSNMKPTLENLIGKNLWEVFPELSDLTMRKELSRSQKKNIPVTFEVHFPLLNVHMEVHAYPSPEGLSVYLHDITIRKLAEGALHHTNQMLQGLIQASPLAIIILDPEGTVQMWNPAATHMFGWSEEEVFGIPIPFIPLDKQADFRENLAKVFQGKAIVGLETRCQKKGGIPIEISIWTVAYTNHQGTKRCISIIADITDKIRLHEELIKIQKLESLGLLAGGIAHDFNNILTGILGNISLAKTKLNPNEWLFRRLTEAEKASLRAAELARQLLTFAKGGAPIKQTVSMQRLLKHSVQFALAGSNVQSKLSFQEELWVVEADEGQISQVIQNIVINAQQAMPAGGTIQIKANNINVGEEVDSIPLRKGEYVRISVEDQGVGIPKELLSKVFDPYFTTKQKGSGLGLCISYSIIQRHQGLITVESEPEIGSTFFIYLPASSRALANQREVEEGMIAGRGRVLVIDDEESVLEVADEVLRLLGYEVELARNGTEALQMYNKARDSVHSYDVVITDLTIPGDIGGVEVLQRLKKTDPEVKVIVSSGYSNDPAMADFKTYGFSGVIMKPYRAFELSKILNRLFNKTCDESS